MKKQLIKTNEAAYSEAMTKYQSYLMAIEQAHEALNNHLGIDASDLDLNKPTAYKDALKMFADKHSQNNSLNLKPHKLAELLEIDLQVVLEALDKVRLSTQKTKPQKEDFSVFAETSAEIERLELAKAFIDLTNKLDSNVVTWSNPYRAPVVINPATRKWDLNHYWIKQIRIR
jgi:uncharacterized protein (DUF927 family)